MNLEVAASRHGLKGAYRVPGDKSISHRAVILGALSMGRLRCGGFLPATDCLATAALRAVPGR